MTLEQAVINLNKLKPSNVSLTHEIKPVIEWVEKSSTKKPKDPAKIAYYAKVWEFTEQNAPNIPNIELRGRDYHIDHKMPISYGYKNNIDPAIIGGLGNLQILHWRDNFRKRDKYNPMEGNALSAPTHT